MIGRDEYVLDHSPVWRADSLGKKRKPFRQKTPEGAVNRFLASKVLGTDAFEEVMIPDHIRSAKTREAMFRWRRAKVYAWRIEAVDYHGRTFKSARVRVWMDYDLGEGRDDDTEEFELSRKMGYWYLEDLP